MRRSVLLSLLFLSLVLLSTPAAAQTPDGSTPAVETVCARLKFATPGLYGLCVAYCEAHDAELDPITHEPKPGLPANDKILENYNKKKSAADPDMPCRRPLCPCFSAEDLQSLDFSRFGACITGQSLFQVYGQDAGGCTDIAIVEDQKGLQCTFVDSVAIFKSETAVACELRTSTRQSVTVEEYSACATLLKNEIARRGLRCETVLEPQ